MMMLAEVATCIGFPMFLALMNWLLRFQFGDIKCS